MAGDVKINWYENDVIMAVAGATDEMLTKLAFAVEGEAKADAPVDTGFMRNAVYAITPLASHRAKAVAGARAAADRGLAGAPGIDKHEAAVHGAAEYTIYQEMRVGFLYGALEKVARRADGILRTVKRL